MKEVAKLQIKDRTELFQATAISMGMQPNVIEKDFWVCFMLDHLFHDCRYKNAFVFKGGTSLSKSYHVIERFSEDIDLILDWRKIINDEVNPWEERSKTKQDLFNKQINSEAAKFYKEELIPQLNIEMKEKLGDGEWISVDTEDEMVVNFYYPQIFEAEYLRSCVRLEIGPLAEWLPSHETSITPFAAEKYPDIFSQTDTSVLTIDVERTFWEKLTILHKIANFPEGKSLPARYARHLYDVYNMGNSWVKESAFKRKELLEKDVAFKQKFYYAKGAHYETATLSSIELLPKEAVLNALKEDYQAMSNMIYGNIPEFEDILLIKVDGILPPPAEAETEEEMFTMPTIDMVATGRNIMRLREAAGLTVRDLQDIFGFATPQAIYKWQHGTAMPTIDNLVVLAAVMDVPMDEIIVIDVNRTKQISA